ncbi:DUF3846 domain-containing protein [Jatrophihabitans cynanchi]|uniref:DUF3846 domain-containing protein n=1 Tax=Jatrophihabitans cynanchi TaxID=2944128 RepID=A0ABY7JRF3_9ACTN|nr:DUF3846 domain-containing protein [Jatrophihabitans sp. SB3-54]WAX55136.1 DUF3846 domain-containing protein [Jatrophihabitans sp. SB3-54]
MANGPIRALRVTPGGAINEVLLPSGSEGQLGVMREQIGCSMVEPVGLGPDLMMWCDEEGFLAAEPKLNLCATGIGASHGRVEQAYVRTTVFTGAAAGGVELDGLTEAQVEELRRECAHVIRLAVMYRLSRPGCTAVDEVRLVQGACVTDTGIGAR